MQSAIMILPLVDISKPFWSSHRLTEGFFSIYLYLPIPLSIKRLKKPHTRYKSHFMSGGHPHTHHFLLQYTMFYVLMQCICIKKCIKKAGKIKHCQLKFILIYVYHFSKHNIFDLCIAFFIFKRTSLILQLTAL